MSLMWEEIMEQPAVLERSVLKNAPVIKKLAGEIKKFSPKSVVIAARGTSDHAGTYIKYAIEILTGVPVSLAAPSVFTVYNGATILKDSLVIGISQSGEAADVIEVIKSANKQGAITLAVTNFETSPLAKEAKYHLFCDCGVEKSVAATKTFTAQLYLLITLVCEWAENEELKKQIQNVPALIRQVFEKCGEIKQLASRYRFMIECFVLARGLNYPIAMESALKIQETAYIRARAYPTSDFHHGPFAMVERDMPVIVYAPEGPSLKDVKEMIIKLQQVEADIMVVSNNTDICNLGSCHIMIPKTESEFTACFCNAVVAQLFACELTAVKGLNPDSPRGLKKVTITR